MIRLAVRVRRREAELVLAELLELAPSGVEEVAIGTDVVEYAVYGAPGELPEVPALRAAAGGALVDVRTEEIADDWSERWRAFHRPLVIGDRLTVRPPWEPPGETALDVAIDPGQAFGTGAHATTRLCLELMLADCREGDHPRAIVSTGVVSTEVASGGGGSGAGVSTGVVSTEVASGGGGSGGDRAKGGGSGAGVVRRGSFVDVGCGSGVLAIVAVKLGFDLVIALDCDPAAVTATGENARRNSATLRVERFDLRRGQVPDADLVVANVLALPLADWAAHQHHLPARLILSGILTAEADHVADAFARRERVVTRRSELGEWTALALSAPAAAG